MKKRNKMAEWEIVDGQEILKVSNNIEDSFDEIKDCIEKKKLEMSKMNNIDQVIAMTSAFAPKRSKKLMEDRAKIVVRIKMLHAALEGLKNQIGNA